MLILFAALALASPRPVQDADPAQADPGEQLERDIAGAARMLGLEFTAAEIELMLGDVAENRESFRSLRELPLENEVPPLTWFDPTRLLELTPSGAAPSRSTGIRLVELERPADPDELAFLDIPSLAHLIRSRQVTCLELTDFFLTRLERLDATLHCVITLTPERARERARVLDAELLAGKWRGPLHGIPWGAKDLLAARGYPTTWGAKPYREQVIELDAAVVQRLDEAGAVLVAKLTLGALAWGDVWFGERTRNPWKPEQGSSGSSAGPASAVAAGAVPFAIGSETLGSIVSPSDRCGCSSLRPSFGRVSRHGAMALSWSMDKLGPICRSATDAALVLAAIHGRDAGDPTTVTMPLEVPGTPDVEGWVVGIVEADFAGSPEHAHVLEELEALGVDLVPVELPDYPVGDMSFVLSAEAASAFDELTRSNRDDELVRQERRAWPNVFRAARMIPAAEYVRANRLRTLLTRDWEASLREVDAIVHPSFAGGVLTATNLTGHPTFVAPCGFRADGTPFSVSFTARLHGDDRLLTLVRAWQAATGHHEQHPGL